MLVVLFLQLNLITGMLLTTKSAYSNSKLPKLTSSCIIINTSCWLHCHDCISLLG